MIVVEPCEYVATDPDKPVAGYVARDVPETWPRCHAQTASAALAIGWLVFGYREPAVIFVRRPAPRPDPLASVKASLRRPLSVRELAADTGFRVVVRL